MLNNTINSYNIRLDQAKGSILGLVAGDALGSTVEFKSPEEIKARYGLAGQTEMRGGGFFNWAVGEYTDDGQMMLCLLESLAATNQKDLSGLNVDDLGRRFVAWYDSGPSDIGTTIRQALARLKSGTSAALSGDADPNSQANGAVMRCSPVAVLWHRPERRSELIRDSLLSAFPTHRSVIAAGACVVANVMIAELINGANFETALAQAKASAGPEWRAELEKWDREGRPHRGNTGWALSTVLTALHCILTTQTFEEAVIKAVNGGSDADTVAAVTGEIAGALYGLNAIPGRWLQVLKDRDKFIYLASRLFEIGENPAKNSNRCTTQN
jgi:ADP-ribosyl-[dinitrogen reductase] hydrolase